jgi:hypothetical protein
MVWIHFSASYFLLSAQKIWIVFSVAIGKVCACKQQWQAAFVYDDHCLIEQSSESSDCCFDRNWYVDSTSFQSSYWYSLLCHDRVFPQRKQCQWDGDQTLHILLQALYRHISNTSISLLDFFHSTLLSINIINNKTIFVASIVVVRPHFEPEGEVVTTSPLDTSFPKVCCHSWYTFLMYSELLANWLLNRPVKFDVVVVVHLEKRHLQTHFCLLITGWLLGISRNRLATSLLYHLYK